MFAKAVEIRDRLAVLVDRLDPDAVSGSAARELWGVLDKSERLCAAGKTLLARRIADTHQRNSGSRSAAEELARRAGTSAGQARDSLSISQRLPDQPEVEQALRGGELSPAQAGLVSEATAADPSQAARLTDLAHRVSLAELREECARVKAAADPDPEATNRRIHAQRRLRTYTDAEGGWNLTARGTAQAGAAFLTVLNAITDAILGQARRDGRHEPVEAYAFDALMAMAHQVAGGDVQPAGVAAPQTSQAHPADEQAGGAGAGQPPTGEDGAGANPQAGGDQSTPRSTAPADTPGAAGGGDPGIFANPVRAGRPLPASRWSNPRYLALLRVDVEALRRGQVAGEELCEIAGVGPIPVTVARDLLGEAIVKLVITNGTDVLNVTHLGRGPTAAQRAALLWINPTCSVESCNRRRIEWDHREPWATTRHTRLDELDPLCPFHHDLKTRCGWALVPGTGKRVFVPPDDPRHPSYRQARPPTGQRAGQRPTGPNPPTRPSTATPRRTRRRAAAAAQTTLPEPPGDPPQAA